MYPTYQYRCTNKKCGRRWEFRELLPPTDKQLSTDALTIGGCPWCRTIVEEVTLARELQSVQQAAQEGIETAYAAAVDNEEDWVRPAESAILFLTSTGLAFSANEIWEIVEREVGSVDDSKHKTALGKLLQSASRSGLILQTGRMVASARKTNHRKITQWIGVEE